MESINCLMEAVKNHRHVFSKKSDMLFRFSWAYQRHHLYSDSIYRIYHTAAYTTSNMSQIQKY